MVTIPLRVYENLVQIKVEDEIFMVKKEAFEAINQWRRERSDKNFNNTHDENIKLLEIDPYVNEILLVGGNVSKKEIGPFMTPEEYHEYMT